MVQIFKWQISSCSAFQAISARLRPEEILPPERWHFALSCRVFKPYSFQISEKTAVLQVSKMLLIGIFLTCLQVWRNLTWSALSPPPRGIYQLPPSVSPVYGYEEGPIFVPYKLSNSRFPMYVGLDRQTYKPVYPQLKVLIPYSKLVTTQKPNGRNYVIYLPFQPDGFRNESCGTPIYIPIPGKDGEFYSYQEHSLDVAPYPSSYKLGGQFPNRPSLGFPGAASAVGFSMGDAVGAITDGYGESLPISSAGIDNALLRQKII